MSSRKSFLMIFMLAAIIVLLIIDISSGSVNIPLRDVWGALVGGACPEMTARIVIDIRLVRALVSLAAGISLSVSGLQMQTLFRNPLAGPYVLGISAAASLAVALFILGAPLVGIATGALPLGMAASAWLGSALILGVIAIVGRRIKDIMVILVLGMMISAGISAVVQILQYLSADEALKSFVVWTMGSLGNVTMNELPLLWAAVVAGMLFGVAAVKSLNLLLLGEEYARTMGLRPERSRILIFTSTTLLAGTVTAFCGPIGFIGLAIPHVARGMFRCSDHRILMPATALVGGATMLACDIVSKSLNLPVNAITSLIGIPIVIWIVMKNRSITM